MAKDKGHHIESKMRECKGMKMMDMDKEMGIRSEMPIKKTMKEKGMK